MRLVIFLYLVLVLLGVWSSPRYRCVDSWHMRRLLPDRIFVNKAWLPMEQI